MDLCTNVGIVSDALKFVTQKQEQINTLQTDKRIEEEEAIEEDTTSTGAPTTNGVF
jgi:hypothetical protein